MTILLSLNGPFKKVTLDSGVIFSDVYLANVGSADPAHYICTINGEPAESNYVLQEGDSVSIVTPRWTRGNEWGVGVVGLYPYSKAVPFEQSQEGYPPGISQ